MPSVADVMSLCLQGKVNSAYKIAAKIPRSRLKLKKERLLLERFLKRFSTPPPSRLQAAEFIPTLIRIYEIYWHDVLMQRTSLARAEKNLGIGIRTALTAHGVPLHTTNLDKNTEAVKAHLQQLGYQCIVGEVLPFRELEIWSKHREKIYEVPLLKQKSRVRVALLSDFLCKGWMAYATMGRHYPGGWATKDKIFCNTDAYNLKSEKFRVSLLAHEAQHYADIRRYPKLASIDLEYRAKLMELVLAKRTAKGLYRSFASRAAYERSSPHAFASFCVVRDLARQISGREDFHAFSKTGLCRPVNLNKAAAGLLELHSQRLDAARSSSVTSLVK